MYYADTVATSIAYIIGVLIASCIFGFITKTMNENKGYQGGFAWGFWLTIIGVIVVACKPDNRINSQQNQNNLQISGQSAADEIKKYKELYDQGIITAEEFQTKKEQLLKLM